MNSTDKRTGAAPSPAGRYDRAATTRRLRDLTIAVAIAGVGGVAGFGYIAAAGSTVSPATVAAGDTTTATTAATTAAPETDTATTTATQSSTTSLQAAPGAVTEAGGAGQAISGGS